MRGGRGGDLFRPFVPSERIATGRVLEVGSNVGAQLKILQTVNSGLELYGLEPMKYALQRSDERKPVTKAKASEKRCRRRR